MLYFIVNKPKEVWMKVMVQVLIGISIITLCIGIVEKIFMRMAEVPGSVAGVGTTGYLIATIVLLLIGANLALLELLKKK
jgi:hypothetical protein